MSMNFKINNILLHCAVFIFVLRVFVAVIAFNLPQSIFFADITKNALIDFVNQGRESAGLNVLTENQKLDQAAQMKAEDMVQGQYFSHTSPTGISPWFWFSKIGYDYKYAGENLAIGFYDSEQVFNAWLDSPSHRANILNPNYKEIGIAVLNGFGGNNTTVVVQLFGSPKVAPAPSQPASEKPAPAKEPGTSVTEPKPEPKPEPVAIATEGQEINLVLGDSSKAGSSSPYLQLLNYIVYDYNSLTRNIVYLFSAFAALSMLVTVVFYQKTLNNSFVFRSLIIAALILASLLFDKEVLLIIFPYKIII